MIEILLTLFFWTGKDGSMAQISRICLQSNQNSYVEKTTIYVSKLAGRLFSPFCMDRNVHKIFTKLLALTSCYCDVGFV